MMSGNKSRLTTSLLQLTVLACICCHTVLSDNVLENGQKDTQNVERQKRDLPENEIKSEDDKRLRSFVGKRSSDDMPLDMLHVTGESNEFDDNPEDSLSYDKRFRQFVGKRDPMDDADMEKRFRQFVGKRSFDNEDSVETEKRFRQFVGKRFRQFVGKRENGDGADDVDFEKRLRQFVGKRSFDSNSDMDKRFRQFVGKREQDDGLDEDKRRFRSFVGKRSDESLFAGDEFEPQVKRTRSFIGKRFLPYDADFVKRLRAFVGKREVNPAEIIRIRQRFFRKPMYVRELVGKRSSPMLDTFETDKRLRSFVGKREPEYLDADDMDTEKRLRQFVGKRLRQFVGK